MFSLSEYDATYWRCFETGEKVLLVEDLYIWDFGRDLDVL